MARAYFRIEEAKAYQCEGCASLAEFAERRGVSAAEALRLRDVGRALASHPELGAEVRSGALPFDSAAVCGEALRLPPAVRGSLDWLALARAEPTRDLRRRLQRRREEAKVGTPVEPVTVYVPSSTRDDFDRARALLSRRTREALSLGQTLRLVLKEWLGRFDPLRRKPGTRRVPDTSQPGSRYVPAEVNRQVRMRSHDKCHVRFCPNRIFVERSHRRAFALGIGQEEWNLDLLCRLHHRMYELGLLRISGPPSRPVFTDQRGRDLAVRSALPSGPPLPR
jgi:hypothetical protein